MEKIKVIKLLNSNIKASSSKKIYISEDEEAPITLRHVKSKVTGEYYSYLSLKEANYYEKKQYEKLIQELGTNNGLDISFEKNILPIDFPMEDILDLLITKIFNKIKDKKRYNSLIFDISESAFPSKDFLSNFFSEMFMILKSTYLQRIIIITKIIEDMEDYKKFAISYSHPIKRLLKLEKEFTFVREDGCFWQYNCPQESLPNFIREHLAYLLSKKDNKYYGHIEASESAHTWVFQFFEKILSEYGEIFYKVLKDILAPKIEIESIDGLISFVYPKNPFGELGGRLEQKFQIQYFGFDNDNNFLPDNLLEKIKKVVLLTDVIYSKTTLKRIIKELNAKGIEVNSIIVLTGDIEIDFSDIKIPVEVLSTFPLPWWKPDACPFCRLDHSPTKRTTSPSERIENLLNSSDLNLINFYKFIKESDSLKVGSKETLQRNYYLLYFDTARIFHKFGYHISSVLWNKIKVIRKKIDAIVCPEDKNGAALYLAALLSKMSEIGIPIICIRREDIRSWQLRESQKNILDQYKELKDKSILIIDDGINTETTKKVIEEICKKSNIKEILGIAVFLNRLSLSRSSDLKYRNPNFSWFYHWPSPPFKEEEFPYPLEDK